ncbi:MAG: sensor histidine kinase [Reyranellaceae bacterium]
MTLRRLLRGQAIAVVGVAIASALRYGLEMAWPGLVVPFATYFPAVVVIGYFGGAAACVSGIVLSILLGWFLFLPPANSFALGSQADLVNLILFAVAAGSIGILAVLLNSRIALARRVEARLHRAHLAGGAADWEWDVQSDRVQWSPALYSLHGLPAGEPNPSPNTVFKAMHPDDLPDIRRRLAQARETGEPLAIEYRVVHADGSVHWLLCRAEALRDAEGRPRKLVGVNVDITTRKEAEQHRELLFHELNHRVKNNFQVVASLLRMQAGRVEDSVAREHLNNAMRRVITMADVHSSLYKAGHIDTVDFADYMRDLCEKIANSVLLNSRVKCHVRAETAVLKVDRAIPLGLVINELVMNSIKHAFPGGAEGEIHVTFEPHREQFLLAVTDNGIGLPLEPAGGGEVQGFARAAGAGSGLGMRLIEAFTQQAGGELKFERGRRGARFEIWLPGNLFVASDLKPPGKPAARAANGS